MNDEKMSNFKFQLGQKVNLVLSEEKGEVIGRAEYHDSANSYFIRYVSADGRQVADWWNESAIIEAGE